MGVEKMKPLHETVLALEHMHLQGMHVTREMIYSLIQSCIQGKDVDSAKLLLTNFMLKYKIKFTSSIGDIFIRFFGTSRCLIEANKVFDAIPSPSVHTWHAIIYAHLLNGQKKEAIDHYDKMMERKEVSPNTYIFSCTLKACSGMRDPHRGDSIYSDAIRMGLESDVVVESAIIDMYSKCKRMEEASKICSKLQGRNVVSWNAMITGLIDQGKYLDAIQLFEEMIKDGVNPDKITFLCVIKAYGNQSSLTAVKLLHELIKKSQFASDSVIGNALIDMYAKRGDIGKAYEVFESLVGRRDVISWSSMFSGYVRNGHGTAALELFERMQKEEGIRPDKVSILYVLKACSILRSGGLCRLMHDQLIRNGLVFDVMVENTLIDVYSKCGDIQQAEGVFSALQDKSVVSWNAMLSAYCQHGFDLTAFQLFDRMQEDGIEPSIVTFSCIMKVCGNLRDLKLGHIIHDQIMKDQSKVDVLVGNTLIDMYTKCGCLNDAHKVFFDLPDRDVVSWGAIISGYQQLEDDFAAPLIPFEMMQEENVEPDPVIILSVLKSCSSIGALNCGRLLHDHVIRNGLESDFGVGNTLVDMYAKCGSLREGEVMFDRLANRNVVSWNAMIGGYAQHGYGELALQWFESMRLQSITPTYYTYISILAACSQSGEVEEGYRHFRAMYNSHKITPGDEHFNCMVNLLGHVGRLEESEELLKSMPFLPDISGWMSLLTACALFGNKELGRRCLGEVARLTPDTYAGLDILVFDIWAEKGIHSAECEEQFAVW